MAATADNEARAAVLKDQGNALLGQKKFARAIDKYTEAIALTPANHVLYSNRSGVLLELGRAAEAVADADTCVKLQPSWPKGYFRLGVALEAQGRTLDAANAFDDGLKLDPKDELLKKCRGRVEKALEKEAAIAAAADARRESKLASGEVKHSLPGILRAAEAVTDPMAVAASRGAVAAVDLAALAAKHKNVALSVTPGRGRGLFAARALPAFSEVRRQDGCRWKKGASGQIWAAPLTLMCAGVC
jgi:tetratricopeptide (TPR) repeat protein